MHPELGGNRSALWDPAPPRTFAALLDGKPEDGFGCAAKAFWGAGGPEAPALRLACALGQPQHGEPPTAASGRPSSLGRVAHADAPLSAGRDGQLVLQRRLNLAPGESVTVPLVYGYEASDDADDAAEAVIGRYRGRDLLALFASQSEARQREGLRFSISGAPEVDRCAPRDRLLTIFLAGLRR